MYTKEEILKINEKLKDKTPLEVIVWATEFFGAENISLSSSLSIEDQVVTDLIAKNFPKVGIFTLDTGKLPLETSDLIKKTEEKYGVSIETLTPNEKEVKRMVDEYGEDLFYDSLENRKKCCYVRKIAPLKSKLAGLKAWITGLRAEQSVTRTSLLKVEIDETFGLVKINPLANWTEEKTWQYIKENSIPYNALYDKGYRSIGCDPCSRAIKPNEDVRSGRWWWEDPEKKECGLHIKNGKIERQK